MSDASDESDEPGVGWGWLAITRVEERGGGKQRTERNLYVTPRGGRPPGLPGSEDGRPRGLPPRSQPPPAEPLVLRLVDAHEPHAVAGAQREVPGLDVNQRQRRLSDQVPASGAGLGVDAGLPPRQADASGLDAKARRLQPGHAAQRPRQVAEVREA